jgi:hypothetical protein
MTRFVVCLPFLFACSINTDQSQTCSDDDCACLGSDSCSHTCTEPGACHVQGGNGPVDVNCDANGDCHVECGEATTCRVDCGGAIDCHVTCPATGCTVTSCVGESCVVACGLGGAATRNGTTATCP